MNKKTRRNFSSAFNEKVVIEALQEQFTLSDLAAKYDLHPNQIVDWKKQLLSGSENVFDNGKNNLRPEDDKEKMLYTKPSVSSK